MNRPFTDDDCDKPFTVDGRQGQLEFPLADPGTAKPGQGVIWWSEPQGDGAGWQYVSPEDVEEVKGEFLCPDCGKPIEATVELDCDVDQFDGSITRARSGGSFKLYCSEDCGWRSEGHDVHDGHSWPSVELEDLGG